MRKYLGIFASAFPFFLIFSGIPREEVSPKNIKQASDDECGLDSQGRVCYIEDLIGLEDDCHTMMST